MSINAAQFGVGYWGPNLLRNLILNENVNLKTVVDFSSERRHFVESHYPGVHTTNDIHEIMGDETIQAVVISTPVETHYDLAIEALKTDSS